MTGPLRCARCGASLTSAPGEICPACLFKAALHADDQDHATVIGPYRIIRMLGEGGMGIVYLGEQAEPIRRTVAVKVIKLGMDTREVVARFESERQALALMDHLNIARVIDAGATPDGRPFFVMEYAPGQAITEYCDAHRLSIAARLALFGEVCAAVQHAHQKGVIHRDLKPSNVLVTVQDGQARIKVIDFGIAKATSRHLTEKTLFTGQGQFVGTPEYMSPEQAQLSPDIATTTDVYSLGVLLYELLVGALPFDPQVFRASGFDAMRRTICTTDPPRMSARLSRLGDEATELAAHRGTTPAVLIKELRGDLDWIVLRALEKSPRRRYASVDDLWTDLTRYLEHEPVHARPPTRAYRVGKFVRRHRGLVAATTAVVAVLTAGFIVSGILYLRAETARREAQLQAYSAMLVAWATAADQLDAVTSPTDAASAGPSLMQAMLASTPKDPELLVSACAGFSKQAEAFVQSERVVPDAQHHSDTLKSNAHARTLYLLAKDHLCLAAMELRFPGSRRGLALDPDSVLRRATKADVPLLYWTAAVWGTSITLSLDRPDLLIDMPVARAIADRALALNESWNQGAIHELLISLDCAPGVVGGSLDSARAHFRRAIALQHDVSARPYVTLALGIANTGQGRDEFVRLLQDALRIDPGRDPGTQFLALSYQRRAQILLEQSDLLFVK